MKRKFKLSGGKKKVEDLNLQYDISTYDKTYEMPLHVFKYVAIRLTRKDGPIAKILYDAFYWFEFLNLITASTVEFLSMLETASGGSFQDAVAIFLMLPCIGYVILGKVKSFNIVYHRDVYENIVWELRDMWPTRTLTREEHNIISAALKQHRTVLRIYYWCNNVLLLTFYVPPMIGSLRKYAGVDIQYHLPFVYWLPYDAFQPGFYEVTYLLQIWHGFLTVWLMMTGDLMFCTFITHITMQFDLLSIRIHKFIYVPIDQQLPSSFPLAVYSDEIRKDFETSNKALEKELREIMDRQRALIRLSADLEEMCSFALFVNFFNSSIILCFCGFCAVIVEKWNEVIYKSFLVTALLQTWMICWYGQRLLESSTDVSHALYKSGWYRASSKIKRSILIMIHRAQKEVHVTTYGFSIVSLSSYTSIIKTSWSYFTLILNVYKK